MLEKQFHQNFPALDSCSVLHQRIFSCSSALLCRVRHSVPFPIALKQARSSVIVGRSELFCYGWPLACRARNRLTQHPRQHRSVTSAAECSSARASSAVLVLSPPLSFPGASVSAKAPVCSTCRRCHHWQTIRQPASRSTVHPTLPGHTRIGGRPHRALRSSS